MNQQLSRQEKLQTPQLPDCFIICLPHFAQAAAVFALLKSNFAAASVKILSNIMLQSFLTASAAILKTQKYAKICVISAQAHAPLPQAAMQIVLRQMAADKRQTSYNKLAQNTFESHCLLPDAPYISADFAKQLNAIVLEHGFYTVSWQQRQVSRLSAAVTAVLTLPKFAKLNLSYRRRLWRHPYSAVHLLEDKNHEQWLLKVWLKLPPLAECFQNELDALYLLSSTDAQLKNNIYHLEDDLGYVLLRPYIKGRSLDEILAGNSCKQQLEKYLVMLKTAIQKAHALKVAHNDIKAQNVIVQHDAAYLIDWEQATFYQAPTVAAKSSHQQQFFAKDWADFANILTCLK